MQIEWNERFRALSGAAVPDFHNAVISDTHYPMWGVRIPALRTLAKALSREDWEELTYCEAYDSYEQLLVTGLAVAYARCPLEGKRDGLRRLLPHLDSWAMTDTIVPTLKIKDQERETARSFALECIHSREEYTIRFGVIMLLDYFLSVQEIPWTARQLELIRDERYYVRMAVAWCYAEMAVSDSERVLKILESNVLDVFTHNKTIQKMRESYRICADVKQAAFRLKRKEERK